MCAQINFEEVVAKQTVINVRVEDDIKNKASKIIADCGLTTSAAIRLFLMRVVAEGTLHFDQFFKPNAETKPAFEEDLANAKRFHSIEELMADLLTPDDDEIEEERKIVKVKSKKRAGH